jgi:predicted Ser/Thr protein kinase
MAKREKILTLPPLPAGDCEVYIPYSDAQAHYSRIHKLSQKTRKISEIAIASVICFVSYLALCFVLHSFSRYIFRVPGTEFLSLIPLGYFLVLGYSLFTAPSNIQIGKEGIRLHWLSFLGLLSSPWISFDSINSVNVSDFKRGLLYKSRAVDICIDKDSIPLSVRRLLWLIVPALWCVSSIDQKTLKLRLDLAAISHEADVQVLVRAFQNFIPAERLGAQFVELQEQPDNSFTKLWLDSLDGGSRSDSSLALSLLGLEPGDTLLSGQYEILQRLAAGGQAVTYLAQTKPLQEDLQEHSAEDLSKARSEKVVLKEFVLPVRGGVEIRRRALENVEHEAKLLQKLNNERIVKFLDCFVDNQKAYLVLEYIDGKSLRKLVQDDGPLTEAEAVRLGIEMCRVLEYLHTLEPAIIHRDFTPENLLLRSTGSLALIDFNVAEQLESKETKTMVGKHCYVSPEQFRGKATTQSDIYACGCTLYWLLTGQDPEPISMSQPKNERPESSGEINAIVACATAIDVSKRFASAALMRAALEKIT